MFSLTLSREMQVKTKMRYWDTSLHWKEKQDYKMKVRQYQILVRMGSTV